jgi:hypothetical protein
MEKENKKQGKKEKKKNKKKKYKSKWMHLKKLFQDKTSYESSLKLLKRKTIEQFTSKCCDIYKEKIQIHLIQANNKQILSSWIKNKGKDMTYYLPDIEVKKDLSDLCHDSSIQDFLFYFRENNDCMLNLIENLNKEKRKSIIPLLCHFFYENFFTETPEQEEILYIIYLLMEKEIDNLYSPSTLSFLQDTFLGEFLTEMGNKYEISHYIDNILNTLIREVEEKNSAFISLDIINNSKMHYDYNKSENSFFDMINQDFNGNIISNTSEEKKEKIPLFDLEETALPKKTFLKRRTAIYDKSKIGNKQLGFASTFVTINGMNYENMSINNVIIKDFFENINENNLKKLLEKETNEIMKNFYIKQIKILNNNDNPDFYNSNKYFELMKEKKFISRLSIEQFNKCFELITTFIDKLLKNLENSIIIPYNIKAICKFIDILIHKKFKSISRIQSNSLICRFLFDKLLLPVLENPDINNSAINMILSLNTRKILIYVYEVLKNIIRGELFNCEQNKYFTIFNKFIINNYLRINNILNNILEVKIPEKLYILSTQFYNDDTFSLDDVQRTGYDINYGYFDEHPNDFMMHKSICFNINQFLLFYGIVHINKDLFFKNDKSFEEIFNNVAKYIPSMMCSLSHYYVIIKEEYNNEVNDLLSFKDKNIGLSRSQNENNTLFKLKYCISHIFNNLKILHFWGWLNDIDNNTKQTFDIIHHYMTFYGEKYDPPINWYSQFITKNLDLIDESYIVDDYHLLYKEIKEDVEDLLKKLKKVNEFLTVNMTTKFFIIENKKKSYQRELEKVTRTELNIKALLFIELTEIKICLMKGGDYNRIMQLEKPITAHKLIISKQKYCPHSNIPSNVFSNRMFEHKFHCKNVKEFADKFCDFHDFISDEVINFSMGKDFYDSKSSLFADFENDILNNENIIITDSPKKILETYMNLIKREIMGNIIFNTYQRNGFEIISTEEEQEDSNNPKVASKLKKEKEDREKVINIIWNYILKSLCNKIYESKSLFYDQVFNLKLISLNSFVNPSNLNIPKEIINKEIFDKVQLHIRKIDEQRTPGGMLEEYGIAVHLVNLLFKFFLNQENTAADDINPVIIYSIITAQPQRIIFNINFSKFFLSERDLLGGIGYNITQAETSIDFIQKLDAKQIGISQDEFNQKCATIKFDK